MAWKYFPILKWKWGEQLGLESLDEETKDAICPIIETRNYQKSTEELYSSIDIHWRDRPFFLDLATPEGLILEERKMVFDKITAHLRKSRNPNVKFCFWSNFLASPFGTQYIDTALEVGFDVCVRIRVSPEDYTEQIQEASELLNKIKLPLERVWLLIDFFNTPYKEPMLMRKLNSALLSWFPTFSGKIALACGCFPKTSKLDVGKNIIQRDDLLSWLELSDYTNLDLIYSDYTCHDPSWEDKSGKKEKGSPRSNPIIRYTSSDSWHVRKLLSADESFDQSYLLMQDKNRILSHCICGGCFRMKARANRGSHGVTKGGYKEHLCDGVVHHIEVVVNHNLRF